MRVVVIGQSVTAIKFLEQLRAQDQEAQLTVIAFDEYLPVFVEQFPELITRQISREDAIYHDEKFYQNLRIEIIADKKISRINFNKRVIFFDDKSYLEADVILIADAEKDRFADIKGVNKEGVFSLRTYAQLTKFLNHINCVDTIVIESDGVRGIRLAQAMAVQDKEVVFCLSSDRLWPERLDQVSSDLIVSLLQHIGIRVLRQMRISEILGETDVKAVRLSAGKVLAAEMVVFPDVFPDMRSYAKSGLNVDQRIVTDELLRTNFIGVFAIDDMAQGISSALKYSNANVYRDDQITRLNAALHGIEFNAAGEERAFSFDIKNRSIALIGDLKAEDSQVLIKKDEDSFLKKRIFIKNNVVQGAFLVDNNDDIAELLMMINNQQIIDLQEAGCLSDCVPEKNQPGLSEPIEAQEVWHDQGLFGEKDLKLGHVPADERVETETSG